MLTTDFILNHAEVWRRILGIQIFPAYS